MEACADALEMTRIYSDARFRYRKRVLVPYGGFTTTRTDNFTNFPQHFDFPCNTALRCMGVHLSSMEPNNWEYTRTIKLLFSTITSPVFSGMEVYYWPSDLDSVLLEMYEIKQFRPSFCLEDLEERRMSKGDFLARKTRAVVAAGSYDFLPSPPSIFFRPMTTKFGCMKGADRITLR